MVVLSNIMLFNKGDINFTGSEKPFCTISCVIKILIIFWGEVSQF